MHSKVASVKTAVGTELWKFIMYSIDGLQLEPKLFALLLSTVVRKSISTE